MHAEKPDQRKHLRTYCKPFRVGDDQKPSPTTSHIILRIKVEEMREEIGKLSKVTKKRSIPNIRPCAGGL